MLNISIREFQIRPAGILESESELILTRRGKPVYKLTVEPLRSSSSLRADSQVIEKLKTAKQLSVYDENNKLVGYLYEAI